MVRGVRIRGVPVYPKPGKNLAYMINLVETADWLGKFDVLVCHFGTNDICVKSQADIIQSYQTLVSTFRLKFPLTTLVLSCIIPRPRDEYLRGSKVKAINNQLIEWCKEAGVLCLRTFSPFTKAGAAKTELFRGGRDMLHLDSSRGLPKLSAFFSQQLSDGIIIPRMQSAVNQRL